MKNPSDKCVIVYTAKSVTLAQPKKKNELNSEKKVKEKKPSKNIIGNDQFIYRPTLLDRQQQKLILFYIYVHFDEW